MEHRIALERLLKMKLPYIILGKVHIRKVRTISEWCYMVNIDNSFIGSYTISGVLMRVAQWMKE